MFSGLPKAMVELHIFAPGISYIYLEARPGP